MLNPFFLQKKMDFQKVYTKVLIVEKDLTIIKKLLIKTYFVFQKKLKFLFIIVPPIYGLKYGYIAFFHKINIEL